MCTTPDVWMRRNFDWRSLGSIGVEAIACMGKRLGAAEMF